MQFKLLFVWLGIGLWSCSESDITSDSDRLGLNYFPIEVGGYRVYDVTEAKYSVLGVTTEIYELREAVADSNLNASNNLQYIIHRSTRIDDSEPWRLDSVWTARRSTDIAVLTENNVPFVKLSFPIEHLQEWDGNSLNTLDSEIYWYNTELPDTTLSEMVFQDIVTVVQNDREEDFLGFEFRTETYAPDVGLIIKESRILEYCQTDCSGEKEIQSGREIVMTLKAYGKE